MATKIGNFRIVLSGCGAVAQFYYAPALRELEKTGELRVTALFDPNPDSLKLLNAFFPEAKRLPHFEKLAELEADLAIVASPPRFHSRQAIEALRAGLSVLCEKPMATTVTEAQAMIDVAEEAGKVLAIGLYRRHLPATQTIRAMLNSEMLGTLTSFSVFEGGTFEWPVQSSDFFQSFTTFGGVLPDIGVHALDLLVWWLGEPAEIAYEDDALSGVEVNSRIWLRFPSGLEGTVRLTREWPRPNHYIFHGTKGWFRWEVNEADQIKVGFYSNPFELESRINLADFRHPDGRGLSAPNFHRSFIEQLRHVIGAVQGRNRVLVSGREGLRSLKLIEHCYRHRKTMDMPWLGEGEKARAMTLRANS